MQLGSIPRVELGFWPTPLHPMPRLSDSLNGPELWIKRDDQSGIAGGGNKVRKLEYLVGQALVGGCDTLITTGGVQSNHARITAAVAAQLGLEAVLVLGGEDPQVRRGNLLLDEVLGASVEFVPGEAEAVDARMQELARDARSRGRKPTIIPLGGSTPVGTVGYVGAVLELLTQMNEIGLPVDHIFVAAGSMGTAAGIYLGCLAIHAGIDVHLVSVARSGQLVEEQTLQLARDTAELLGWDVEVSGLGLHVYDQYVGEGYGIATPATISAIQQVARLEGIILDPVYTGKAMAGMLDQLRPGVVSQGDTVLFWHTGGMPGLFAKGLGMEGGG